jgi:hypothetical protein
VPASKFVVVLSNNALQMPDQTFSRSLASVQLTRDADVQFYTGLSNTKVLKTLFDHLSLKASVVHYWKVPRQTLKQAPMRYFMDDDPSLFLKPGPGRKLKLKCLTTFIW